MDGQNTSAEALSPGLARPLSKRLTVAQSVAQSASQRTRSTALPRGAQMDLMNAAVFSKAIRCPLNVLVTINARELHRNGAPGLMSGRALSEARADLLERMRKWVTARGLPWVSIWVREHAYSYGEHWHISLHLPKPYRGDLAMQMTTWTGVNGDLDARLNDGDIAVSVDRLWHIGTKRRDGPQGSPEGMAAYLGKAEPSRINLYGKMRNNPNKVRRDRNGGQGPIRGRRYGISRSLNTKAQAVAGFTPPYQRKRRQQPSQRHTDAASRGRQERGAETLLPPLSGPHIVAEQQ